MATYSAQILIGTGHPNDGGISHDYNSLKLAEGDSIAWIAIKDGRRHVWLPRNVCTVLEDGLLMAAALYMDDSDSGQTLSKLILDSTGTTKFNRVSLSDYPRISFTETFNKLSDELNTDAKTHQKRLKMIFTIFNGSALNRQIDQISSLGCDVEILTTSYIKEYSPWSEAQMHSDTEINPA
ncbi:hypothetical protein [Zhongshania borealis]|uniref:Uncharacterized protein n=1 Tax=Zhongshania borealis TaxID=889488 RepID=A0ABP7X724_9GAMM